ncbi:MAG: SLAP domain-containing protein [Lactobacillus sp.]|nr:SLAP domain-containing protein [Lactobacillus sp.]
MRLKKVIAAGLASVALLGTAATSVSAAKLQLVRKSYVYNAKGKKTKTVYRKDRKIKVLGTKKIKGKKYYRIGKNKYILIRNFKKKPHKTNIEKPNNNSDQQTPTPPANDTSNNNSSDDSYVDPQEQARKDFEQHMKDEQQKFGDWILNGKNN